ncbi:MAG TPA: patatin [Campylobacterales bacterium]|nr:patatin [Campylobacterales bacterium]
MKKTVSLVLGSGGARGYAHIGVIEALEEQGYKIVSISGSSMGALVGGLYAAGKLDLFKKWILSLDVYELIKLVDFSFAKNGMIKGDKVFENIEKMVGKVNIQDLPITFTAVATNLHTEKPVWLQKGDLLDAVRASVAIPTILTPKKIGNQYLVDGGILTPLPTVPLLANQSDYTIAVNIHADEQPLIMMERKKAQDLTIQDKITSYLRDTFFEENEQEFNSFKIVSKTIETMQNLLIRYELAAHKPDLIIEIPKNICDFYDFHKAKELIDFGKKEAIATLKQLT